MNIKQSLQGAYLDWVNNYLTIEKYAEHNQISIECAMKAIEAGKQVHEQIVHEINMKALNH